MTDEPEYLRRLHQHRRTRSTGGPAATPPSPQSSLTTAEQEAIRWAREVACRTELRSIRNLAGARFAAVMRLQGASGVRFVSLEGFADRAALIDRVKPGATVGEEVMGAYEVRGGRPVVIETDDAGQIVLRIGAPRPGAHPVDPEKMLRQAAAEAAQREKMRPRGGPGGRPDRGRSRT